MAEKYEHEILECYEAVDTNQVYFLLRPPSTVLPRPLKSNIRRGFDHI